MTIFNVIFECRRFFHFFFFFFLSKRTLVVVHFHKMFRNCIVKFHPIWARQSVYTLLKKNCMYLQFGRQSAWSHERPWKWPSICIHNISSMSVSLCVCCHSPQAPHDYINISWGIQFNWMSEWIAWVCVWISDVKRLFEFTNKFAYFGCVWMEISWKYVLSRYPPPHQR